MYNRKKNEITSKFYDDDSEVNCMEYLNERCFVKVAVKFDNIYFGNSISLQLKLLEADVSKVGCQRKRLISNAIAKPRTEKQQTEDEIEVLPENF